MKRIGEILWIDDNREYLALVRYFFTEIGWNLKTCESVDSALASLQQSRPHLILLDLNLPDRGGEELLQTLAKHQEWHKIPVIIVSATEPRLLIAFPQVVDWIPKTTGPTELQARVNRICE
jgi:DNA-binding response OmpR family regulator